MAIIVEENNHMKLMRIISNICLLFLLCPIICFSCKGSDENSFVLDEDASGSISPVVFLRAEATGNENEIKVKWTNPSNKDVERVELSYKPKDGHTLKITDSPLLINVTRDSESMVILQVPCYAVYEISAIAINKEGKCSAKETIFATPYQPVSAFLERADELMTSMLKLYFGKSPRDCWNDCYPNATGPFWDGDAVVWGQGGGLSGFVAIRKASLGMELYEGKYTDMTDRMYNSINRFITSDNGKYAYGVYPANGNERFYDDNVWIGLDMVDLYIQTRETRFLEKAIMVWNYLMTGYDETCGGGIHWREIPATATKHTCSTAPTVVMACKLYQLTKEDKYLDRAIQLYQWLKDVLQDPEDYLYWDNVNNEMEVSKEKFTYNSGQPMQAACLLYQITGDMQYLADAQHIAQSAYERWFIPFNSDVLEESFRILEPGHVWFQAILLRGYLELYKIDKDRTYVTAYEKTLTHAWLTDCRNKKTSLLNDDFRGGTTQTSWKLLYEAACVEMMARLALLEHDEIL